MSKEGNHEVINMERNDIYGVPRKSDSRLLDQDHGLKSSQMKR